MAAAVAAAAMGEGGAGERDLKVLACVVGGGEGAKIPVVASMLC